ncbi:hypothetical protein ACJMK2_026395 [Sinanodonta woodiana]|uniref:Uncharacterized protein n=1 Tax=Sinanodonta woodiana TaxID=1069815 RepID=A0ABD3XJG1_SINWO
MDLHREYCNREYKEAVKTTSDHLTDATICMFFFHNILNCNDFKRCSEEDLVNIILDNKCYEFISGRCHSAFLEINYTSTFNQMGDFKKSFLSILK